ncbi:MAG: hypothetical protein ABIU77_09635 [Ferruginibacter sp.]
MAQLGYNPVEYQASALEELAEKRRIKTTIVSNKIHKTHRFLFCIGAKNNEKQAAAQF